LSNLGSIGPLGFWHLEGFLHAFGMRVVVMEQMVTDVPKELVKT
jgi:hypothetical protein